jgi:hypothetical protein
MENKIFIEKSKKMHGDRYDYSCVNFINGRINVEIICKIHGNFNQRPFNHLMGKGCPECSGNKKMNLESFILKSKLKHGDRYNYSNITYVDSNTVVEIVCPEHGAFKQTPKKHISGSGCQICGGSLKSDSISFIKKSNDIHNYKYDYSRVNYINNKTKVEIICKIHNSFFITPSNHLKGTGCSKCSGKSKLTVQEFIKKSSEIHNSIYDYSKVKYINHKSKVTIICSYHGEFHQVSNYHLSGHGCPKCRQSKNEKIIENYLIEKNISYKTQYKFDDLKYKKHLKFDFAILDKEGNLDFLIEYNGEQHYKYRGQYGMDVKEFDKIKTRDKIKINYCINNKIDIFIIRYDEDVNSKLEKIFYLKN